MEGNNNNKNNKTMLQIDQQITNLTDTFLKEAQKINPTALQANVQFSRQTSTQHVEAFTTVYLSIKNSEGFILFSHTNYQGDYIHLMDMMQQWLTLIGKADRCDTLCELLILCEQYEDLLNATGSDEQLRDIFFKLIPGATENCMSYFKSNAELYESADAGQYYARYEYHIGKRCIITATVEESTETDAGTYFQPPTEDTELVECEIKYNDVVMPQPAKTSFITHLLS